MRIYLKTGEVVEIIADKYSDELHFTKRDGFTRIICAASADKLTEDEIYFLTEHHPVSAVKSYRERNKIVVLRDAIDKVRELAKAANLPWPNSGGSP